MPGIITTTRNPPASKGGGGGDGLTVAQVAAIAQQKATSAVAGLASTSSVSAVQTALDALAAGAASDAELAAAVATLNGAMATDAELAGAVATLQSAAATDDELAAAVATVNAAMATDAELAGAVGTLNAAIAAVTAAGPAGGVLTGTYPAPDLAAGVVRAVHVAGDAAIPETSLVLPRDISPATAALRKAVYRSPVGWYKQDMIGGVVNGAGSSFSAGFTFCSPMWVAEPETWDKIELKVITGGAAGAVIRCGVCAMGADGKPGARILDLGTLAATTSNAFLRWTNLGPIAMLPGAYFVCFRTEGAPATNPVCMTYAANGVWPNAAYPSDGGVAGGGWFDFTQATGAFADPIIVTPTPTSSFRPCCGVHVLSRP